VGDAELLEALRTGVSDPDRGIDLQPLTQQEIDEYLRNRGRMLMAGRALDQRLAGIFDRVETIRRALGARHQEQESVAQEPARVALTDAQNAELDEWLSGSWQPAARTTSPARPAPTQSQGSDGRLTRAQDEELDRWLRGET
jgi:hypothetical protein